MSRLWWHVRRWWAWITGASAVDVTFRLRKLTYERFERACLLVGLDPDDVRKGEADLSDAEIGDVRETGPELIELLCTNHKQVRAVLDRADKPVAEQLCAHLLTRFFFRCVAKWNDQTASLHTMLNGAASTP